MTARIAIIGRGIAGLTAAFRFALAGHQVVVIGPPALAGSASVVAQGLLVSKGLILARDPLYALKLRGQRELNSWLRLIEQHAGLSLPRRLEGALEPFWSEAEYRYLRKRIFKLNFAGFTGVDVLSRDDLGGLVSADLIKAGAIGAFLYPFDGWFDPQATLAALEIALKKLGVGFCEAACERVEFAAPMVRVILRDADVVVAKDAIIAAGAFSGPIMLRSGLSDQMLRSVLGLNLTCARQDTQKTYLPLVHGRRSLVVTDYAQVVGAASSRLDQTMPSQDVLDQTRAAMIEAAQEFTSHSTEQLLAMTPRWGVRLNTADRRPLVGFANLGENRRLGFLTALYKSGLQIADLCAQQLCHAYESDEVSPAFSPERFLKNP